MFSAAGAILSIVGFPGKSTGECIFAVFLGLLGACIGCANFAILSQLQVAPVGQAAVFAVIVFLFGLAKASDERYFKSLLSQIFTNET